LGWVANCRPLEILLYDCGEWCRDEPFIGVRVAPRKSTTAHVTYVPLLACSVILQWIENSELRGTPWSRRWICGPAAPRWGKSLAGIRSYERGI